MHVVLYCSEERSANVDEKSTFWYPGLFPPGQTGSNVTDVRSDIMAKSGGKLVLKWFGSKTTSKPALPPVCNHFVQNGCGVFFYLGEAMSVSYMSDSWSKIVSTMNSLMWVLLIRGTDLLWNVISGIAGIVFWLCSFCIVWSEQRQTALRKGFWWREQCKGTVQCCRMSFSPQWIIDFWYKRS